MSKCKSLYQQFNYATMDHWAIGESKHNQRNDPNIAHGRIYSIQSGENMRQTYKQFCKHMHTNHPEIKWVKDIQTKHVQEWIDSKRDQWSNATAKTRVSQMRTLSLQIDQTYKLKTNWTPQAAPKEKAHNIRDIRDIAMSQEDLAQLRQAMAGSRAAGRTALEITERCGLRVKEVARLHSDRINTDKWILEIREGAKGGKSRNVPIREQDRTFFLELKKQTVGCYVTRGYKEDSLNQGIRRAMTKCGLNEKYEKTTAHAIRKKYATERFAEEKEKGFSDKRAWSIVQEELGHGVKFREELFRTYIK